ncbi:hypothetical protein Trydic_g9086 [Trypoxylus dichotomus]
MVDPTGLLGPRLESHRRCNTIYADDTAIVATSRYPKILTRLAQAHLAKVEEFPDTWALKIEPKKQRKVAVPRY